MRELLAAAQFAAERVSLLALGLLELGEHDDLGDIEAARGEQWNEKSR